MSSGDKYSSEGGEGEGRGGVKGIEGGNDERKVRVRVRVRVARTTRGVAIRNDSVRTRCTTQSICFGVDLHFAGVGVCCCVRHLFGEAEVDNS